MTTQRVNARQEQAEKDKKALLSKDFVKNNPIFTIDHITEFHQLFLLFADPRTKRIDVRDILTTAKTLGLDTRYHFVFRALIDLHETYNDDQVDFETFIKDLTDKLGSPFNPEARRKVWEIIDPDQKESIDADDLKVISKELNFNLQEDDIKDVIENVAGYDADAITYDKYEKYMVRKIQRRQIEADLKK